MDGKTGYVFKVDGVSGITFDQYGIILKGSYLTIKKTDGTQAATITVETDGTLKITPAAGEQVTIASNLAVSGGIGASGDIISSQSIGGEVGVICPTYPDGDPIQGSIRVSNLVFYWYSGGAWHFAVEN
jgi:hypothetical protein